MPLGLLALALGGFGIGLTEFVIAGLLPEIAADLDVGEATAGWLISGYALSVAGGAIGITAAVSRRDRKGVLVVLMLLFIAGSVVSAIAPGYGVLMVGRVLSALCHGAFFGIGSVLAASLVAPERRAGAVAAMFTGLTASNVVGVPLGTLVGQQHGWRATFWVITGIGVVALLGLLVLVPSSRRLAADAAAAGQAPPAPAPALRTELAAFAHPQVWVSLLVTVLGFGGLFGAFTYIAFTLTGVSGFAASSVPWLLLVFGVGMVIGNTAGGRAADRSVPRTLLVALSALALVMVGFALTADSRAATVVALVLMAATGFAAVPGLQLRVMGFAGEAPTLASGANIAAFNVGNALGAWIGGVTITAGLGYTSPLWAGAAMAALGVVVLLAAGPRTRRGRGGRARPLRGTDAAVHFRNFFFFFSFFSW